MQGASLARSLRAIGIGVWKREDRGYPARVLAVGQKATFISITRWMWQRLLWLEIADPWAASLELGPLRTLISPRPYSVFLIRASGERVPLRECHSHGSPRCSTAAIRKGTQLETRYRHLLSLRVCSCPHLKLENTGQRGVGVEALDSGRWSPNLAYSIKT